MHKKNSILPTTISRGSKLRGKIFLKLFSITILFFIVSTFLLTILKFSEPKPPELSKEFYENLNPQKYPKYFKKFLKTNSLDDLLKSYAKFHKKALEKIVDCRQPMDESFLIFHAWYSSGLGNIMIGLTSSFTVALLTGRVFLVNWPGYWACKASVDDLFETPGFDWSYQKFRFSRNCWKKNDLYLEMTHRGPESKYSEGLFRCSNFGEKMSKFGKWIEISSNQYFVPLLKTNPFYEDLFKKIFFDGNVFRPLANFLFKPKMELQKRIDEFVEKKFPKNGKVIGIQIRRNEKERQMDWFREKHEYYFWECAKKEIISKLGNDNYKIYIASDNATVKDHAISVFGKDKILYLDVPLTFSRSKEDVKNALVDVFLLSKSDYFIVSKWSTFGNVAHGLAGINPYEVRLIKGGKAATWEKLKSSEPHFHWHWRANHINCKNWKGDDDKQPKTQPRP